MVFMSDNPLGERGTSGRFTPDYKIITMHVFINSFFLTIGIGYSCPSVKILISKREKNLYKIPFYESIQ